MSELLSALNISQTWSMLVSTLTETYSMLADFVIMNPLLASIYPLMIILLIMFNQSVRSGHRKVIQSFVYEIDRIMYQFALTLHQSKPTLVRREDQLDVMYTNKKAFFSHEWSWRSYTQSYTHLLEDVQYLQQLTGKTLVTADDESKIHLIGWYLKRSQAMYTRIGATIAVMTLGLYSLFQPKLS